MKKLLISFLVFLTTLPVVFAQEIFASAALNIILLLGLAIAGFFVIQQILKNRK